MRNSLFFLFMATLLVLSTTVNAMVIPQPGQQSYDKRPTGSVPDLDQNRDYTGDGIAEQKWCAPTAAADSVWYYGNGGYPNLIPAGINNSAKADALIKSLGGLMGTSDAAGGTTIAGTVAGLQQYFNNNYPGTFTVSWNTAFSLPDNAGAASAQNLWNWMTGELLKGGDILPIIWLAGQNGHQGPPTEDSEIVATKLDSVGGHLVMMSGYNIAQYPGTIDVFDPDDNVPQGIHVFPPPIIAPVNWNLTIVGNTPQGTALAINGGAGGWIVGAIEAIPEPATLCLLGLGVVMMRRKRNV